MRLPHVITEQLDLTPLPVEAAAALPDDREAAARALGAALPAEWPDPHLVGILRRHQQAPAGMEPFGVWAMIDRSTGEVVGDIGFHGPPDDAGTVEIGYSVVPSRRRRGLATEAATALVDWACADPRVHVVVAGCDPANAASQRILERTGFERTGEADGELRWRRDATPGS